MYRFIVLVIVLLYCSVDISAQADYAAVANYSPQNLETKSLLILYTDELSEKSIKKVATSNEEVATELSKAELYDLSVVEDFGTYMNPYNNYMTIVPKDDIIYTKLQIIKKGTGLTVAKEKLDDYKSSIDLSGMAAGTYILILTDQGRNIYSEEITIY